MSALLGPEDRRVAEAMIPHIIDDPEWAAFEIVSLRTQLASELVRREAVEEEHRGNLFRFGDHSRDCRVFQVGSIHALPDDCSCGFWVAVGAPPYDVAKRAAALAQEKPT